jgi:hypothetical protein
VKPQVDVEEVLQRLGNHWPAGDSLVEGVLRGIESHPPRPAARTGPWRLAARVLAVAASLAAVAVLWWLSRADTSLYAQTRDAVHRARTFQMIVTVPADGGSPEQRVLAVWYERGVGFREEQPSEVAVGNREGSWRYLKEAKLAIRSSDGGMADMVDRALDNEVGQALKGAKYERYEAGDQAVDGQSCRAYLLTKVEDQVDREFKAGKRRMVLLLDDRSRVMRIITEVRSQDRWVVRAINDWRYDVPLDPALFKPRFGDDVRVVNADEAFGRFVDLEKAVHREERKGLWYAIHHVERFENGGLFLVSSVRGTDATLKKYPLTQRRLRPGITAVDGPATTYRGSQEYRVPGYAVELACVDHQGINVSWWVLLPVNGVAESPFDVGPGKVKVPVGITATGGAYGRANFTDAQGVLHHLTWDVDLDVPQPKSLPSLDAIARQVYADVAALDGVPFKYLNMGNRGLTVPTVVSDLNNITAAQFSEAVADDIRWWREGCPADDRRFLELRKDPAPSR